MPLVQTRGAASAQGFGEFAQATAVNYIEEMFSCFLYTGNGSTQTITNGIDLSTKGGLVWIKDRTGTPYHVLTDTVRGVNSQLYTNSTADANSNTSGVTAFNSNGFNIGSWTFVNTASDNIVSWTFREQPKFFDVVTYTGTGSNTTIAHSLGAVPGSIIVKRTDTTAAWAVYHRSLANTQYLVLNTTAAAATGATWWNSTTPTSAVFSVGTDASVNASGGTYVAYLFAHDAGGFGLTGTDNVISCGSFTSDASSKYSVNLGYEPQWLMVKRTNGVGPWYLMDTMRNFKAPLPAASYNSNLEANTSAAEDPTGFYGGPTATGFADLNGGTGANNSFIYIAIRRGPMKVPTLGTSVFSPQVQTPSGAGDYVMAGSSGFPIDWLPTRQKSVVTDWYQTSRLTNNYMSPNTTAAEGVYAYNFALMQGVGAGWSTNSTVSYAFRRAPGFFDVVCYTGTGTLTIQTLTHNLGVAPEMVIVKSRSASSTNWLSFISKSPNPDYFGLRLNTTAANAVSVGSNGYTPTIFSVYDNSFLGLSAADNQTSSGVTYVAYLFATCAGVSKVGSYTGNGSSQTINCGFTAGSRFVMIKRTDSTGDWYVWDSARGIVAGNDPHLSLNDTAAEVTTDDSVDTDNTGFIVNQVAATNVNVSSATYIGLAIA